MAYAEGCPKAPDFLLNGCASLHRPRRYFNPACIPASPEIAGLAPDPTQPSISKAGRSQTLTPTEFRLPAAIAGRPGRVLARRELVRAAWPHGAIVQDNTLDVFIARIRRKLARLPDTPQIATQHGVGYRLG